MNNWKCCDVCVVVQLINKFKSKNKILVCCCVRKIQEKILKIKTNESKNKN